MTSSSAAGSSHSSSDSSRFVRADIDSARLMLGYLGKATQHYNERQFARQKLKIELSRLKKVSTQSMRKYVRELERSITHAISKEQHILQKQKREDAFHGDLQGRIRELEERLARYLTIHEARARRVKLLETALGTEQQSKSEKLVLITKSLERLERIYDAARKERRHPKQQLAHIKKHLDALRAKARAIGTRH